uniref:Uncharacterized protein n=1 Tax=Anguilla anguilla TaxID=7936 RepID=A0A0E9T359_ANGAN
MSAEHTASNPFRPLRAEMRTGVGPVLPHISTGSHKCWFPPGGHLQELQPSYIKPAPPSPCELGNLSTD